MSWDRDEAIRLAEKYGPRDVARMVEGPYTSVWRHIQANAIVKKDGKNILLADIETAPMIVKTWGRRKQYVSQEQVIREPFMMCWAAKWLGDDTVMTDSLFDNERAYWKDPENDKNIAASMWRLLDKADVVVFQNGDRFDIPLLNTRFLLSGFKAPAPYKRIDTLKQSRNFRFTSHGLNAMAQQMGIGKKEPTGGFDLWNECEAGSPDAWEKMVSYCANDVEIMEGVYLEFRGWDPRHPNMAMYSEDKSVCGVCMSPNKRKEEKSYYTSVNKYDVYRCIDCGGTSRSRKSTLTAEDRLNLRTPCGK